MPNRSTGLRTRVDRRRVTLSCGSLSGSSAGFKSESLEFAVSVVLTLSSKTGFGTAVLEISGSIRPSFSD